MAITPRTILTNPATVATATVSVLAVAAAALLALGTCPSKRGCHMVKVSSTTYKTHDVPCDNLRRQLGHNKATWSEFDWFQYATCFDQHNDSRRVIEASSQGIGYYPRSEALYNLKGYHLIKLRRYEEAVKALDEGMRRVGVPSSGTMPNNLAWAGVWVPREMTLDRARALYEESLRTEPGVCETLHTGLWVEYAVAKRSRGIERAVALKRLNALRAQYEPCHTRYQSGEWNTLVEVLGAAVIFEDLEQELGGFNGAYANPDATLIKEVSRELRKKYRGASIDALCRESIPVADAHHACVKIIDNTVTQLRVQEKVQQVQHKRPCGMRRAHLATH